MLNNWLESPEAKAHTQQLLLNTTSHSKTKCFNFRVLEHLIYGVSIAMTMQVKPANRPHC